ncbi:mechanosensitive ion channel protein 10-like isoform X2 [Dendrobium catenatum]|uniref:mechanosensitive ion channel protein 10-like isoform X2 n=1 Tax=Dendrobium catenatum TaxID=906689 RepID=UPI0009F743FC|nr:mechanosensitive ion channel protein 10-like isoform X2 [Dendrobium catenatum]
MFEGALDTGRIKKSAFRNWVVRAYRERKSLAHSLNDTKTAVQQLHKLASVVVSVIIFVVSLLVTGVATTKVFVAITSQLLLLGFLFQSTGKTLFESIVFVFVMHPFDVGDRCVIDGVQMIVEEMNILTTVFLRHDNEKIYYPNAVLLTKPISNFYRSPHMFDTIEFHIDVYTPVDTIAALRKAIQAYLESKPKHWNPKHTVLVKEIENVNKMKMSLNVLHTMNHQNFPERNSRRSELVLELKKIFESLGIKYNLLPQEVHLTQVLGANPRIPAPPDPAAYLWSEFMKNED